MSVSDFQTGTSAAAHATLDTEHLFLYQNCVCWYSCLPTWFWGRLFQFQRYMIIMIHNIMDTAVCKQADNTTCILAYLVSILPSSIVWSGLNSSLLVTIVKTLFLLVSLGFMAT